ncbi:histidine ammonia-lyase [Amycolatopsis sp. WQ 127309]|uniref:HAL/PAL/TAL family ammonia-lyase n=1 Tax=Amycolatopsis sp. WQ 127309 TaxID=2932773 RepID=UPI001FF6F9C6|nr:aromatic amino acid ammonia-lyase [Amycolatopsis sp. WQ 127309]UOZ06897.1 histidine ammonia-lyase [Amycolatopsis sp. WQ 127309]
MADTVVLDTDLTLDRFVAIARHGARVEFAPSYADRVRKSRSLVERFLLENRLIYGVTTGFGDNYTEVIAADDAVELQRNIVRSHAVSVGACLEEEVVRAIWLMELVGLGKGFSGVRLETLDLIRHLLNTGVCPRVPGEGSVGYLAPEAHMALVLMGEGQATVDGELLGGLDALRRTGAEPVVFGAKEGLALTNGTHSVTAIGALAAYDADRVARHCDLAAAMSFEALKGNTRALDPRLHALKRHAEQNGVARNLSRLLHNSVICARDRGNRLQDPLGLRAVPQMHGAARRVLKNAVQVVCEELCSVGDNPVIYPEGEDGEVLTGGNFDGTYVGLQADSVVNALAVLAKISERRTDRMVNGHFSGLPAFLAAQPGLHNGYMMLQYTAAALCMELRALAWPASADTVPTSANQEDAVSNAYLAATKAYRAAGKLHYVVAIELLCAAQALDFLVPDRPGPATGAMHRTIRAAVPTAEADRAFHADIGSVREMIRAGTLLAECEKVTGPLE